MEKIATSNSILNTLMNAFIHHKASDLHLKEGHAPLFRVNGRLLSSKLAPIEKESIQNIAYSMMNEFQKNEYEENKQLDFSYELNCSSFNLIRTRVNLFTQKGQMSIAIRRVPTEIPSLTDLGLEDTLGAFCKKKRGLILITGKAGSGKSTTLSSTVDFINQSFHYHVITLEDPIEFVYRDKKSIISQREINLDINTILDGVKGALRQDPDVIVVGEMLDFETIKAVLTAAETGHLVISTLHTKTAAQTISRIIDGFPMEMRGMIRLQLSASLIGVFSQRLIPKKDKSGLTLNYEVLVNSPSIAEAISQNKMEKIEQIMENSNTYYNMNTFNQHLQELCKNGIITEKAALQNSHKPEDLNLRLSDISSAASKSDDKSMNWQDMIHTSDKVHSSNDSTVVVELDKDEEEK